MEQTDSGEEEKDPEDKQQGDEGATDAAEAAAASKDLEKKFRLQASVMIHPGSWIVFGAEYELGRICESLYVPRTNAVICRRLDSRRG